MRQNNKVLYAIFSPLQFLNAKRLIDKSDIPSEVFVLTDSKVNIKQIRQVDKNNICFYPFESINFLNAQILWLIKLFYGRFFIPLNQFQQIVIGNFNNIIGFSLALRFNQAGKKIIVIDDGLATVDNYIDRNRHGDLDNKRMFGGKFYGWLYKVFRLDKYPVIEKLTFLTNFDLSLIEKSSRDEIQLLPSIPSTVKKQNNEVWFVGSPVVELGIVPYEIFDKILDQIHSDTLHTKKLFYYNLHRAERKKINKFSFQKFDIPIESALEQADSLPSKIISFYSTALVNIASTYPQMECEYVDLREFLPDNVNLNNIYEFFEAHQNLRRYVFKKHL